MPLRRHSREMVTRLWEQVVGVGDCAISAIPVIEMRAIAGVVSTRWESAGDQFLGGPRRGTRRLLE